ncbi:DUF6445 family protein [Ideonella sp. DXS22W]|uniref:DUF6445 family protein n=1 Tax=Pseudaquabacterium inlustre TaxID=2984192 RepID=A0ABU9CNT2_9BURK
MSTDSAARRFALNPQARVQVQTLSSGCPVLVIDDVYADPMAVRERALAGRFDNSTAYYPGLHAALDETERAALLPPLVQLLAVLGSARCTPADIATDFSIVTTPASEMLALQKHPHVDGTPLAGVCYLNPDYEVGTSFFRHRPTGLAFVRDEAEGEAYHRWLDAHGDATQPSSYAVADDHTWEHLHTTQGRFNRLVMYPGTAFHSIAMTDVARNLSMNSARLTQRFFVHRADRA